MAVSNTDNKVIYVCDGVQTEFDYTFKIFETSDLLVQTYNTSTEVTTTLTEGDDYTVAGAGEDNGGVVTTVATYGATIKLVITRQLPLTQSLDYVENDPFPAESHEEGLDRAAMIAQQLQEQIDRAVTVPAGSDLDPTDIVNEVTTASAEAVNAASTATTQAGIATTQAGLAAAAKTAAETAQGLAETAKTASEAARDLAQNYAAALIGTSTSSVAIGTGSKTFTTQASKQWVAGDFVIIANTVTPSNYMFGQVTSYSSTTLIVNVIAVGGSGTLASWNISISGIQGATGSTGATGPAGATGATGPAGDGLFNSSPILAKTGTYTLTSSDREKLVTLSGTFTVSLPAIVDGHVYKLTNIGAGTITIAANGAETSEVTSLAAGASVILIGDLAATKWRSLAKDGAGVSYTTGTFVNGDLSTGVLTITHNKGLSSPYIFSAEFFDNNGDEVYPDSGTPATNSKTYSFVNFGTLSGTYSFRYL